MENNAEKHFYIFPYNEHPVDKEEVTARSMMSFFLLLNTIVPLDLGVVLNIVKGIYTLKMIYDYEMVDVERSEQDNSIVGCNVKNLTMVEDLAKVNHIFCDKTGTLTKNELIFRSIAFDGTSFMVDD